MSDPKTMLLTKEEIANVVLHDTVQGYREVAKAQLRKAAVWLEQYMANFDIPEAAAELIFFKLSQAAGDEPI